MSRPRRRREEEPRVKVVKRKGKHYLRLRWPDPEPHPVTGNVVWHERSAETSSRREAERKAAKLEEELAAAGGKLLDGEVSWIEFCKDYRSSKRGELSPGSLVQWKSVESWLERTIKPETVADITTKSMIRFAEKLREIKLPSGETRSEATIAGYLRRLSAAMSFAVEAEYIARAPKLKMPKRAKGKSKAMRSRPITGEEFDRMLDAVPHVRPHDAEAWRWVLVGLWYTGLRVSELLKVTWDATSDLWIDVDARTPALHILAEGEKGHEDRLLPLDHDLVALLKKIPAEKRVGLVFPTRGRRAGEAVTGKTAARIVSNVGRRAGVVTAPRTGKRATAHDLRRAFGTRWSGEMSTWELTELMRHKSVKTTEQYYVGARTTELSKKMARNAKGDPSGDPPALPSLESRVAKEQNANTQNTL